MYGKVLGPLAWSTQVLFIVEKGREKALLWGGPGEPREGLGARRGLYATPSFLPIIEAI